MTKPVYLIGDAVVDFIPDDSVRYLKCPGGAPANSAVGVARLGGDSRFLGKVGGDPLGRFLRDTLDEYGVNTELMLLDDSERTSLVLVDLDKGERSFTFMVRPSADQKLTVEDLPASFPQGSILHLVSIALANEPVRSATIEAVKRVRRDGGIVSFDPNIRPTVWADEGEIKPVLLARLAETDVLKVSEEELEFLTGESDLQQGLDALAEYQIPLILVTFGAQGSYLYLGGELRHVPTLKITPVDTTGAGDAFVSGILYQLSTCGKALDELTADEVAGMVRFASVCGARAASAKGAMTALPTLDEVNQALKA